MPLIANADAGVEKTPPKTGRRDEFATPDFVENKRRSPDDQIRRTSVP